MRPELPNANRSGRLVPATQTDGHDERWNMLPPSKEAPVDRHTHQGHARDLQRILHDYAPGRNERLVIDRAVEAMISDGVTGRDLTQQLVGMIGDGLKYGNWPWLLVDKDGNYC